LTEKQQEDEGAEVGLQMHDASGAVVNDYLEEHRQHQHQHQHQLGLKRRKAAVVE
jgi:hypothetical protein